ncbi:MAG: carboxynorspermidine decarboxylase [Alkalispirochaeta sp.]
MARSGSPLADPRPYAPDDRPYFRGFDPAAVPSPAYVIDRAAVAYNLRILREVADRSGATILLALKAFALPEVFDLVARYLDGVCASGVYEATLGFTEIAPLRERASVPASNRSTPREPGPGGTASPSTGYSPADHLTDVSGSPSSPFRIHTFAPAYTATDLDTLRRYSNHLSFNSLRQYHRHFRGRHIGPVGLKAPAHPEPAGLEASAARPVPPGHTRYGIRINPECPLGDHEIYDPCAPYSRLGQIREEFDEDLRAFGDGPDPLSAALHGISGLHFHTLCENDSHALEQTLAAVTERFGDILEREEITWLNMGGGHHITKPDYDRDHLVSLVRDCSRRYGVDVILEPGEAAAIHTGILVSEVLDITRNRRPIAILDTSATAHMPDTLEMPYRPDVWGAHSPGEAANLYRLGGTTCLAGDVIGDYAFNEELRIGDRLVFDDMSHYTMVKTTTFNGIPLPTIAVWDSDRGEVVAERRPEYSDFRARLGGMS